MRGKLLFGAGLGLGYVLGTRAGRERFGQISEKAKQVWESKAVQDVAGAVQDQAGRVYESGRQMMSEQADKMQQAQRTARQQESAQGQEPHVELPVSTSS